MFTTPKKAIPRLLWAVPDLSADSAGVAPSVGMVAVVEG
jgi:hypothetical protein